MTTTWTISYLVAGIAVMAIITYLLRALPFAMLKRVREHPVVTELANSMPLGVMVILVVYSLMDARFDAPASWLPLLLGTVSAFALYLWRRSVLLAIIVPVAIYGIALALL